MSDATTTPPDLETIDADPAQPIQPAPPSAEARRPDRGERGRASAYRSRFVVVYACLALVAACGIGAFVVALADAPDKAAAPTEAAPLEPTQQGEIGAMQLAEVVQRKYRLPNGEEFTGIVASRNTLQDGNLGLVRVNYQYIQPLDSQQDKDSEIVQPQDAIQYSLCGANVGCTIPGKASRARFVMLKRQALELAIRTFQNDPDVDNVAVFLRPVPPSDANWEGYTMVFDRSLLNHDAPRLLGRPLSATLPSKGRTITASQLSATQMRRINELTRPYLYLYRYQLLGGREALMQLQPAKS